MSKEFKVSGMTLRRVGETTLLDDAKTYAVVAKYKDGDGDDYVKTTGSYDVCADYAERNESDDNVESYFVAEVVAGIAQKTEAVRDAELRMDNAEPGSLEWARAHADLEQAVYAQVGLDWSRDEHFVTKMEREASE